MQINLQSIAYKEKVILNVPEHKKGLSLKDAINIFDQCADMEDIAFGYMKEGCPARAHLLCQRLLKAGIKPSKAWAIEDSPTLYTKMPDGKEGKWWFHVAPTIPVKQDNGSIEDMIIDPSLFDGPVTKEEWGNIMGANTYNVSIRALGKPALGQYGDYNPHHKTNKKSDADARKAMEKHLKLQDNKPREVFPSQARQDLARQQRPDIPFHGKTWQTSIFAPVSMNNEGTPSEKFNDAALRRPTKGMVRYSSYRRFTTPNKVCRNAHRH